MILPFSINEFMYRTKKRERNRVEAWFLFLNEVHKKILMEEYRYNGTDFTKK